MVTSGVDFTRGLRHGVFIDVSYPVVRAGKLPLVRKLNCLFWRGSRLRKLHRGHNTVLGLRGVSKLNELRELLEKLDVDPGWVRRQNL